MQLLVGLGVLVALVAFAFGENVARVLVGAILFAFGGFVLFVAVLVIHGPFQ